MRSSAWYVGDVDLRGVCEEVGVHGRGPTLDEGAREPANGAGAESRDSVGGNTGVLPPPLRVGAEVLQCMHIRTNIDFQ